MMEAARTSETLVNFYQTTRRYNPEHSHLRTHRRENLKSYLVAIIIIIIIIIFNFVIRYVTMNVISEHPVVEISI
jgi:t-SNARE complex subunit (syntaxin)